MGLLRRDKAPKVLIGWAGEGKTWSLFIEPWGTEQVLKADESVEMTTDALAKGRVEIMGHETGTSVWMTSDDEVTFVTLKGKKLRI